MADTAREAWTRRLQSVVVMVSVFVTVVYGSLWALQERLIFHPAPAPYEVPADGERVALRLGDGTPVVGLWGAARVDGAPVADPRAVPTAVFCLGNGGTVGRSLGSWAGVRDLGANVLMFDYPGYGESGGAPTEASVREAAVAAYEAARARPDVDPTRLVAFGHSLGGAVAIDLASREPVAGLVAMSTFTSMADMAWHRYFLPRADLLLRHPFRSVDKLPAIHVPTFLAHGDADPVVPFAMMDRLARVAGGPVTTVVGPRGTHAVLAGEPGAPVREGLRRWFAALPPRQ